MQKNGTNNLQSFVSGWSEMMVDIWQEKLVMLNVHHTGALLQSVEALPIQHIQGVTVIPHKFLEYGIYVDRGTGREFSGQRNERGQLVGRNGKKTTVVREPRPWFATKRFASIMKLRETVGEIYGRQVAERVISTLR